MAYRDDVTALSARHDALASEVAEKTRELEASRQLLEQARKHAKLPVLDNIRVASPCTASWSEMTGDDRERHCGQCRKNVYNLSGMTRDEAEALIRERSGDLCVRYYQRHDGTILLADCTVGRANRGHTRLIAAGAAGVVASALGAAVAVNHYSGTMGQLERPRVLIQESRVVPLPSALRQPSTPREKMRVTMGVPIITPRDEPAPTPKAKLKVKDLVDLHYPDSRHGDR